MLFIYTLPMVLNGTKTQTRRLVGENDAAVYGDDGGVEAVIAAGRTQWRVGKTYGVQPGYMQRQVARIKISAIRQEPVSAISEADARAEGFADRAAFMNTWREIHGDDAFDKQVWVLAFELVEVYVDVDAYLKHGVLKRLD